MSGLTNELFVSGTSFEKHALGAFDPKLSDEGVSAPGPYHWAVAVTNETGTVLPYDAGEAYDYEDHGLTRNPKLDEWEPDNDRYLRVATDDGLLRAAIGRSALADPVSNLVVRSGARESIYCDTLVRFTPGESAPEYGSNARLVVWARLKEQDDETFLTNLMVTAGYYRDGFRTVEARDYVLDFAPDFSRWYRLTIRAHGDVSAQGIGLGGFSIYIDGRPVAAAAAGYEIADPSGWRPAWLTAEARALQGERRFFPGLSAPGSDAAFTVSGLAFAGDGSVDDISFSTGDPGYGSSEAVFTLNWDPGVTALEYTLGGGVTNVVAVESNRACCCDILIGAAPAKGLTLKVTKCAYDAAHHYRPGVWLGRNGATATNVNAAATAGEFVFDGTTRNPVATVASSLDCVGVGTNGAAGTFTTFASAFAALDRSTNAVKILQLVSDVTVTVTNRDAYLNRDAGSVRAANADGEYELDLNGHTLTGAGRDATVIVKCRSFRIYDSSKAQTGRIVPSAHSDTAVSVQVQADADGQPVEPLLTLESGTYDGLVRNQAHFDGESAQLGTVIVEGGAYLSTNPVSFYLDNCVTNPTLLFVYGAPYWSSLAAADVIVWTGLGDGLNWSDPENWKAHRVPEATETAYFPVRDTPWTVDVGLNGMTTKSLWLAGDVRLSGTNDFLGVTLSEDGAGRFLGDALLVYEGDQPGRLTSTTLHPDWAGTVLLRDVGYPTTKSPKILRDIETWGTERSTVVFEGVRGYVMDAKSHTMAYSYVLRDHVCTNADDTVVTNLAWRNDSGYTGSTLAYWGPLSGDGTFSSGYNSRSILQLFKFANATNFTGRFVVNGKRVLVGSETAMAKTPGLIVFGDHAVVSAGRGWTCRAALFSPNLHVRGDTNDFVVTCTVTKPDVSACTNLTLNGIAGIAWLACTNDPQWAVYVSGERPASASPASAVRMASAVPTRALAAAGSGYEVAALAASSAVLAAEAVEVADVWIEVGESAVTLTIPNASDGLWYGVRSRATLSDDWSAAGGWRQAAGSTVTLTTEKLGDAGFYGVVVTYEDPTPVAYGGTEGGADE